MAKKMLILIFLAILSNSCASTLKLSCVPGPGQSTVFEQGSEVIISNKNVLIAVRPFNTTYPSDQRPIFIVSIFNSTKEPFNFSTENIHASVNDEPLKIFTYDELIGEIEYQRRWTAISAALLGMNQYMNATSSGYSYHEGTFTSPFGSGTYSGTTYNPWAVQMAQSSILANTLQNVELINNQAYKVLKELEHTILRKSTVFPQFWHGGYIQLQKPLEPEPVNNIKLVISVTGDEHIFLFSQTKFSQDNKRKESVEQKKSDAVNWKDWYRNQKQ